MHCSAAGQVLPHAPQFVSLVEVLTQALAPLQKTVPEEHPHAPLVHSSVAGQACPHPPQFAGSVCVLMQFAPHVVSPAPEQVHVPAEQSCPCGQTTPHAPQSFESDASSQTPPHVTPLGHTQAPATHVCAALQEFPQAPQFDGSVWVATHARPQGVVPLWRQAQLPPRQL